ncbi:MAG: hypothetical protein V2I45_01890 [Halieaceae bacterium]|jgi:nitrogen regulatory protein PII|nr:hypothetical protein [Halieaceae bacterium]
MRPCKRVEIVIERSQAERLAQILKDAGAPGFTIIHHAGGAGDRGYRRADDVTDTDENWVFVAAIEDADVLETVVNGVQPLLKRFGGICLVSDALVASH